MAALKTTLQEVVRAELLAVFEERPGSTMEGLDGAMLRYLSRICKVHEETALTNQVDAALGSALQTYCAVNKLEERMVRKEFGELYDRYAQTTPAFIPQFGRANMHKLENK